MIQKGFLVTPTDASIKFVEYLKNESLDAQLLNLINDEIKDKYDMVFANAVLVHFTALQTKQSFKKIHDALKESGIFSFRIKEGMGSGWADHKVNSPRYFKYWKPDQIKKLLNDANFRLLDLIPQTTDDNKLWLQFITRKN
jgi:chemotaxis methyl-accepting protein methylase